MLDVPPIDTLPAIVAVPPIKALPDIQTSLSNSTLSPNVLLVNVCVAANPANVSADAGNTKLILPENAECAGAFTSA